MVQLDSERRSKGLAFSPGLIFFAADLLRWRTKLKMRMLSREYRSVLALFQIGLWPKAQQSQQRSSCNRNAVCNTQWWVSNRIDCDHKNVLCVLIVMVLIVVVLRGGAISRPCLLSFPCLPAFRPARDAPAKLGHGRAETLFCPSCSCAT